MADLLKPSRNAVKDALSKKQSHTGAEGISYFGSHDLLGVLRVRAKGNTLSSLQNLLSYVNIRPPHPQCFFASNIAISR